MADDGDQDRTFRSARPEEDDLIARILCNAFLPLWNHNWFHGVSEPLRPVSQAPTEGKSAPMSGLQRSRIGFYRALVTMTRLMKGSVLVAEIPGDSTEAGAVKEIAAILLWLPPQCRMGTFDLVTLYRSGFLSLMLPWHYGARGLYRIDMVFEENIRTMFSKTLPDVLSPGTKESDCGFVQMLASNPKFAGKRCASALLKYQIGQHFSEFPDRPVVLDTTTAQGIRAYEKLGFKLLAEEPVNTGTDAGGIPLKPSASEEEKQKARETCIQRVMVRLP